MNIGLYNFLYPRYSNYYRIATHCTTDFRNIGYYLDRIAGIRWRSIATNKGSPEKVYLGKYKGYNKKQSYIGGKIIYPMSACRTRNAMCFSKEINKYTTEENSYISLFGRYQNSNLCIWSKTL